MNRRVDYCTGPDCWICRLRATDRLVIVGEQRPELSIPDVPGTIRRRPS